MKPSVPTVLITALVTTASLLAVPVLISGCSERPPELPAARTDTTTNGYQVVTLFEYDGCKMIRFVDKDAYRYFAKCGASKTTSEEHTESCGKGCTRRVITQVTQEDGK